MPTPECTCKIMVNQEWRPGEGWIGEPVRHIAFCPLHAAAGKMYEAIQFAIKELPGLVGCDAPLDGLHAAIADAEKGGQG